MLVDTVCDMHTYSYGCMCKCVQIQVRAKGVSRLRLFYMCIRVILKCFFFHRENRILTAFFLTPFCFEMTEVVLN